eukprot:scaffold82786_cov31-Tisochrysis_lutea.AAC.1
MSGSFPEREITAAPCEPRATSSCCSRTLPVWRLALPSAPPLVAAWGFLASRGLPIFRGSLHRFARASKANNVSTRPMPAADSLARPPKTSTASPYTTAEWDDRPPLGHSSSEAPTTDHCEESRFNTCIAGPHVTLALHRPPKM